MSDRHDEEGPSGPSKADQTTTPKLAAAAAPAAEHKTIPKSLLVTPPPRAKKTPREKSSVPAAAAASPRKPVTPTKAPSARLASSQSDISTPLSSSSSYASSPSKVKLVPPQDTLFDILLALAHNTPNHGAYGLQNAKLQGDVIVLKDEKSQKEIFKSYPTLKGIDREQLITLARQLQSFEQAEVTSSGMTIGPGVGSAQAKYDLLREDCVDYLAKNLHIEKGSRQHKQIMKTLEFICHSYRHASVRHPETLKPGQDTELMPRRNLFYRALTNPAYLSRIPDWTLSYTPRKAADRSATPAPVHAARPSRTPKSEPVPIITADRPSPPATPLRSATTRAPQPAPVPIPAALPPSPSESPELMIEPPPRVETPPLRMAPAIEVPPVIIEPRVPPRPLNFQFDDPWGRKRDECGIFTRLTEELKRLGKDRDAPDMQDWFHRAAQAENDSCDPAIITRAYKAINAELEQEIQRIQHDLGGPPNSMQTFQIK